MRNFGPQRETRSEDVRVLTEGGTAGGVAGCRREGGLAEHAGGGCGGREGPRQRDTRLSPGGSIHGGEVVKRREEES